MQFVLFDRKYNRKNFDCEIWVLPTLGRQNYKYLFLIALYFRF